MSEHDFRFFESEWNLYNTVHLHEAQQISDEATKSFAARVRGIGSNCVLSKQCTCGLTVSFLE